MDPSWLATYNLPSGPNCKLVGELIDVPINLEELKFTWAETSWIHNKQQITCEKFASYTSGFIKVLVLHKVDCSNYKQYKFDALDNLVIDYL